MNEDTKAILKVWEKTKEFKPEWHSATMTVISVGTAMRDLLLAEIVELQAEIELLKLDKDKPARAPKKTALVTEGKEQFSDYVFLKTEEHQKLCLEYGGERTAEMIRILDAYIPNSGGKGLKYTDHYRVLIGWVALEWEKRHGKAQPIVHRQEDAGEHNARIKAQVLEKLRNGGGLL